jgi:hypothetical protein
MRESDAFVNSVCINHIFSSSGLNLACGGGYYWGCRAEHAKESPTELHLACRTFADNIAIYILDHFAGRDSHNGRRGYHLVGGPAGHDGGLGPSELLQDEADSPIDTCRVVVGLT